MSLKLYGINNCSTVKKARNYLEAGNVEFEFHDFKKLGLDESTAKRWLEQQEWTKLVNRSGMTWRKLTDEQKAAVSDANSALVLMLEKNSVIKRPILERDGQVLCVGFDELVYQALLGK